MHIKRRRDADESVEKIRKAKRPPFTPEHSPEKEDRCTGTSPPRSEPQQLGTASTKQSVRQRKQTTPRKKEKTGKQAVNIR